MKTTDVLVIGSGIAGHCNSHSTRAKPEAENHSPQPSRPMFMNRIRSGRRAGSSIAGRAIALNFWSRIFSPPEPAHRCRSRRASSPRKVQSLLDEILIGEAQIQFDRESDGTLSYGQEAAHSRRRIVHVADGTGAAISNGLVALLKNYPNIEVLSNATAVDLITYPHHSRDPLDNYRPIKCHGAYVFDHNGKAIHRTLAAITVLATGGLGRIYRNTTNPAGARGDGLAMASRAGARIINAEYIQFHPTALAIPGAEGF